MTDHIDTAQEREKLAGLAGFTPGPWSSTADGCIGPEGSGVAVIVAVNHHGHQYADRELIAAAPDLLDLNRRLLDALDAERARAEKAEAEVDHLRAALNDIYENVEYWNTLRISSRIRAAMQRKEGNV